MTSQTRTTGLLSLATAALTGASAQASFQAYYNSAAWQSAVGGPDAFTTIGFNTGTSMVITDQYAGLGVLFPEGDEFTGQMSGPSGDGWGMNTNNNTITMLLTTPRTHFAMESNGWYTMRVYFGDSLLAQIPTATFTGVFSDIAFDRVVIVNTASNGVTLDDIHFGGVPGPGGLGVLVVSALMGRGGRRRSVP